jgi:hypothetical protein
MESERKIGTMLVNLKPNAGFIANKIVEFGVTTQTLLMDTKPTEEKETNI